MKWKTHLKLGFLFLLLWSCSEEIQEPEPEPELLSPREVFELPQAIEMLEHLTAVKTENLSPREKYNELIKREHALLVFLNQHCNEPIERMHLIEQLFERNEGAETDITTKSRLIYTDDEPSRLWTLRNHVAGKYVYSAYCELRYFEESLKDNNRYPNLLPEVTVTAISPAKGYVKAITSVIASMGYFMYGYDFQNQYNNHYHLRHLSDKIWRIDDRIGRITHLFLFGMEDWMTTSLTSEQAIGFARLVYGMHQMHLSEYLYGLVEVSNFLMLTHWDLRSMHPFEVENSLSYYMDNYFNYYDESYSFFTYNEKGAGGGWPDYPPPEPQPQSEHARPQKYTPGINDKLAKTNLSTTMNKQLKNTCVTSIMEYTNHELCGGNINEGAYWLDYRRLSGELVSTDGVELQYLRPLVNMHFETTVFCNYKNAIDKGYVVMTDISSSMSNSAHNVLVVGYKADSRTLIYMDPEKGRLQESDQYYLGQNYNIVITSCK